MRLFHTTTPEAASAILREGFRDTDEELHQGRWYHGSWFSDERLSEIGSAFLAIELPDELAQQYELSGEFHGYRRWLIPASVLAYQRPVHAVD